MASPFDLSRQRALMFGACTGLPAGTNLAIFANVPAQRLHLLVVDHCAAVRTELADSWAGVEPAKPTLGGLISHDLLLLVNYLLLCPGKNLYQVGLSGSARINHNHLEGEFILIDQFLIAGVEIVPAIPENDHLIGDNFRRAIFIAIRVFPMAGL
jgi:hypothetical protein